MSDEPDTTLAPWIVEHSTHVLKDRWISVRADRCRTEEGVLLDPFYVLEYPDWVLVVAIDNNDRVILVEQYRHGWGTSSLELPTGGVELDDESPIATARRELEEETGYRSDHWQHLVTLAPNPGNQSNRCHVILAKGVRQDGVRVDDPTERVRIVPTLIEEAAALARTGGIMQAMHVAALSIALTSLGQWLLSDAASSRD
jgi:8-oxo-dGTP pyrophosphatase MutT (NUDIX family)